VTDLGAAEATSRGWRETAQHSIAVDEIHNPNLCDLDEFRRRVRFRVQDMTAIDADLRRGEFDFVWSLCALEHLGSLQRGLEFVERSLECVRPGGIAVHTTEYNVSSNDDTVAKGATVLYRRRDIEALAERLRGAGCEIELNLHPGDGALDGHYDLPPYRNGMHLKLEIARYVATSLGLVIRKPGG
jgi:hypothetical protein